MVGGFEPEKDSFGIVADIAQVAVVEGRFVVVVGEWLVVVVGERLVVVEEVLAEPDLGVKIAKVEPSVLQQNSAAVNRQPLAVVVVVVLPG